MPRLTDPDVIRALRYYQGDVEGDDPFWGDPKAYVTLNALFFPGLTIEKARSGEGKRLNPEIPADPGRLMGFFEALSRAFTPLEAPITVSRVERLMEYEQQRARGRTVSFTSTSTNGFLGAYGDKRGLALMRYALPAGTPCVRLCEALPSYLKADEAELLLPPGLGLRVLQRPLRDGETPIRDMDGRPPALFAEATATGLVPPEDEAGIVPDDPAGAEAGVRVLRAIAAGREPDGADSDLYIDWKRACAARVRRMFLKTGG